MLGWFSRGPYREGDLHPFSSLKSEEEGRSETMHAELGALSEFHLQVSQGDLVHDLSPVDVKNAFGLAEHGYQQLRPILEPGRTFFNVTLCFDEHTAEAVIQILTVVHQESGHSKSDVVGAYQPCCHQVPDERIRSDVALVYNSYIRANRRTFDNAWYGIVANSTSLELTEIAFGDFLQKSILHRAEDRLSRR